MDDRETAILGHNGVSVMEAAGSSTVVDSHWSERHGGGASKS